MTIYEKNKNQVYGVLVSKFIHERYSQDDEFALINNYNADPQGHAEEYAEYQAYRAACKQRAREICGMEENNG